MRINRSIGIAAVAFALGGLATFLVAAAPAQHPVQTWEYQTMEGAGTDGVLNHLGAEGWELVSVTPTGRGHGGAGGYLFCFKRAK